MTKFAILAALIVLSACSRGTDRFNTGTNTGSTRGATGEISRACLAADRSAASPALCGCAQSVANSMLSSRDRNRIATFFADPEVAHATKISDTAANDAFWERYQAYVRAARNTCG